MIGMEGKTLRSERLTYRLLTESDKPALRAILSGRAVTEPAGFLPAETDEAFDKFFAHLTQYNTALGIYLGDTLIGYIHVNRYRGGGEYAEKSCVDTGFVIGKAYQNCGYATETLRTLTAYLKQRFDFCFADCFLSNEPSRRVIERCGYRYAEDYTMLFRALGREETCHSYVY